MVNLLRCLMVQKPVQYVYIAKCISFVVSTEEGDYYEATEAEKEKSKMRDTLSNDEDNYL